MAKSATEQATKADTPPPRKPLGTRILDALPIFVSSNLRSKRSRKIWIRCWVAAWASFVLMLPQKSLTALGNASFFGILTSLLIPPNAPVQMYLFGITIYMVGECVGWSIGCIAMKIALKVRNQTITRESLLRVEQMAASSGSANPEAVFEEKLFEGAFLDTRASVIYGVLIAIGAAFFAFARARVPKLFFFSMFGMIFLDAFCTYGPLFPIADYTVVDTIVISASCSMAIGIACCVLIFPETMNHWYLDTVADLLGALKGYSALHRKVLDYNPDEVSQDADGVVSKSAAVREGLLMGIQALGMKSALINVEFSFGRWSGDDAKAIEEPLKVLVSRMSGFDSFPRLMTRYQKERANQVFKSSAGAVTAITLVDHQTAAANINDIEEIAGDTEIIRQLISRRRDLEEKFNVRCEDVFVNLRSSTSELRDALTRSIGAIQNAISVVNTCRWRESRQLARFTMAEKELDDVVENLRLCLDEYKHDKRYIMLQPFIPLLQAVDDATRDGDAFEAEAERRGLPIRSLIIACVYASNLVVSSDASIELLDLVRETCHKRRKARLWAPSKLRQIAHWLMRRERSESQIGDEDDPAELEQEEVKKTAQYKLDPDSRPPGNAFQTFMNKLHLLYLWFSSAEGIFVVKYTILTVVMWIPSVFKSSAKFYYEQKGLWALVMAQTTCYMFAADQFFNYVMRLTGTFLGLVVALFTWYAGNGHGNGNPYGLAAAFGVVLIPVAFGRAFLKPMFQIPYLMFTSTLSLAIGYSWIDGHLFVIGSPGIGWEVVWKRFVVVASGCVGSFLVMIIPPTTMSGRKAVRTRHAAVITELSSLYALLMSGWITDFEAAEETAQSPKKRLRGLVPLSTSTFALHEKANEKGISTEAPPPSNLSFSYPPQIQKQKMKWIVEFSRRMIALSQQIQALKMQTMMSRWEGNFRGTWPFKEYMGLIEYEGNMLAALQQLAGSLDRLDSDWKTTLNQRSLILNPDFITDVMSTFALVAQSLRTSEPMHQILPTSLLDRLLFEHTTKTLVALHRPIERTEYVEKVQNPEFMYFATGIASVSLIIGSLDDMHKATKRLCGEVPFSGFDRWRAEYEQRFYGP